MVTRLLTFFSLLVVSVISAGGYAGVVVLMALGTACIPVPSEIVMPFAGYLAGQGRFQFWGVAVAGVVGCNLGAITAYWMGALGGRPLIERYGPYLLISRRELHWADRWFARYGDATVFFGPMLPIIRTFIALPAGVARMNFLRFVVFTFAGSLPYCVALAYLGVVFGEHWQETIHPYFQKFDVLIGLILLAALVWFIHSRWQELRAPRVHSAN